VTPIRRLDLVWKAAEDFGNEHCGPPFSGYLHAYCNGLCRDGWITLPRTLGAIILVVKNDDREMIFSLAEDITIRVSDCLIVIGGDVRLKKIEALANSLSPNPVAG